MKYILLILLSIFTTIGLFACDDATGSITTVVDNNNGTYTVTIDVCMEFNGIEGSPYGIAFNFNNLNTTIVNSFTPASFSSLAGDLYPGIIRDGNTDALGDNVYGTNDGINNILQYYYTGSFPGNPGSNLLCNTFNITITGYPTSVDVVVNADATSFGDCTRTLVFPTIPPTNCGSCALPTCNIAGPFLTNTAANLPTNHCSQINNLTPSISGANTYFSYHNITTGTDGTFGVIVSVGTTGSGICSITRNAILYLSSPCSSGTEISPTATGMSTFYNPEWTNLSANTTYVLAIEYTITSDCDLDDHCQSYYYPASPPPTCDCSTPNCAIFFTPNGANSTSSYPTSNQVDFSTSGLTSLTNCYTATVTNTGQTLGFRQGITQTFLGCINRTYELKAVDATGACSGPVIPNTGTGTYSSIFNPEWTGLTPGDYVMCITLNLPDLLCDIDNTTTGYYLEGCFASSTILWNNTGQMSVCENNSIQVSISNSNNISPFVTEYVMIVNGTLYGPNTTGLFDLEAQGITGPSSGNIYAVNHDGTETFANWPTATSNCIESINKIVTITTCDTQNICANQILNVSVSNANTSAPYILEYIMVCAGNNYGLNSTGVFNIDSLGIPSPSTCTIYAVNHDGTETFTNWPIPISSCLEWVEQYINITQTDSTFETATSCLPADTGIVMQNLINVNNCDSTHTITTILLASDSTFETATSCLPADTGIVVQNLINVNNCDSTHTITTILSASDSTFETATSCLPADTGIVVRNLINVNNCDSTHTITTTLLASDSTFETATSCLPADTGIIVQNLINVNNCDSIHTITTTLLASDSTFETATSCLSADTGIVVQNLINVNNCDSTHTITTTLLASDSTFETVTSCLPADTGIVVQNLINVNNCDSIHTITTKLITFNIESAAVPSEIEEGESVNLFSLGDNATNYSWTNVDGSNNSIEESFDVNLSNSTVFYLTATYLNCTDTDTVIVIVNKIVAKLLIPNAFSPNLDGTNDGFGVVNYKDFDSIFLRIYNRWGELIFKEKGNNPRWDGTYKGIEQQIELYIYIIEGNKGNKLLTKNGNVSLIR